MKNEKIEDLSHKSYQLRSFQVKEFNNSCAGTTLFERVSYYWDEIQHEIGKVFKVQHTFKQISLKDDTAYPHSVKRENNRLFL